MSTVARTPVLTDWVGLLVAGAVTLTALAGVAHLIAGMQHLPETTLLGCGLLATGVAQLVAGVLLAVQPSTSLARGLLVGTVLALAVFALQHTAGIPGLAHADAGEAMHYHASRQAHTHRAEHCEVREPLALTSVAAQLALIIVLVPLVWDPASPARRRTEPV